MAGERTKIVFAGGESRTAIYVPGSPDEIAKQLQNGRDGLVRLEGDPNPVWVNVRNVLYVESGASRMGAASF